MTNTILATGHKELQPNGAPRHLASEMTTSSREESFAAFFQRESERLRRLGVFLTGDADRGADLAQEALARTYRHWGRIENREPGPYATKILVNLVRSSHRRRIVADRFIAAQRASDQIVGSRSGEIDEWLRVSRALKTLSPIQRATVLLRFYQDLPEAEIGWILDRPVGTVKSDLHRALKKLRPLLEATTKGAPDEA
jgi:RNA polymerase sigma-70 factor (sigma-E family)